MLEDSKILHKTCINILQNKNCDIKRAQNMHIPLKTWFCYEMCKKKCTYPPKGNLFWDQMWKKHAHHGLKINDFEFYAAQSYIYIYIDSKVIYVPLFEYMYFALFCVLSISNIENIAFKWTHDDDCFFGIYATLLRLKCIKPPYAQITMFAKENQLYGYTNPTRMFESITASCHLTFITCLLLFGNYITFANFLTIRIFHCKSPHLTEKVGCGGWA